MFLKLKQNGVTKRQECADGQKHHLWTTKEDSTSPTMATESVLLAGIIEAKER